MTITAGIIDRLLIFITMVVLICGRMYGNWWFIWEACIERMTVGQSLHLPYILTLFLLLQVACVKSEMSKLHTTLEQEKLLASQHQLTLQAQISEAQARVKVNTQPQSHCTGRRNTFLCCGSDCLRVLLRAVLCLHLILF